MNPFYVFLIRAVLGVAFAVLITRMFRGEAGITYVAGLAIILVGLSYFAEYLRHRRKP
jgi:succinate-acetate transporter protein